MEMVGAEDQSGTPPRRESTRVRVKPRRHREEECQTIQEKAKLSPRERRRRQSLAKQRASQHQGWVGFLKLQMEELGMQSTQRQSCCKSC